MSLALQKNHQGNIPIRLGNICSLSMLLCTQLIKCSMYSGADILVGRLNFSESCQRYSNLGHRKPRYKNGSLFPRGVPYSSVAFISGHVCGEQNSVMDP